MREKPPMTALQHRGAIEIVESRLSVPQVLRGFWNRLGLVLLEQSLYSISRPAAQRLFSLCYSLLLSQPERTSYPNLRWSRLGRLCFRSVDKFLARPQARGPASPEEGSLRRAFL